MKYLSGFMAFVFLIAGLICVMFLITGFFDYKISREIHGYSAIGTIFFTLSFISAVHSWDKAED